MTSQAHSRDRPLADPLTGAEWIVRPCRKCGWLQKHHGLTSLRALRGTRCPNPEWDGGLFGRFLDHQRYREGDRTHMTQRLLDGPRREVASATTPHQPMETP
jgi:hypothetical protein